MSTKSPAHWPARTYQETAVSAPSVDSWLLMRATLKHLDRLEADMPTSEEAAARIDFLVERIEIARDAGVDRATTCATPRRTGGGFQCPHDPACDAPYRALVADLGELEAITLAFGVAQ